jgi:peptidoglycan/LPS O-acetylase OafA/YrhL
VYPGAHFIFFFSGSSLLCERKSSRNTSFFACVACVVVVVLCLYIVFVDAVFLAVSVLLLWFCSLAVLLCVVVCSNKHVRIPSHYCLVTRTTSVLFSSVLLFLVCEGDRLFADLQEVGAAMVKKIWN